eukprot:577705-Rhodomonas_salina.1
MNLKHWLTGRPSHLLPGLAGTCRTRAACRFCQQSGLRCVREDWSETTRPRAFQVVSTARVCHWQCELEVGVRAARTRSSAHRHVTVTVTHSPPPHTHSASASCSAYPHREVRYRSWAAAAVRRRRPLTPVAARSQLEATSSPVSASSWRWCWRSSSPFISSSSSCVPSERTER